MCSQDGVQTFLPRPNQFTPHQQKNQGLVLVQTKICLHFPLSLIPFELFYYLFVVVYIRDACSLVYKYRSELTSKCSFDRKRDKKEEQTYGSMPTKFLLKEEILTNKESFIHRRLSCLLGVPLTTNWWGQWCLDISFFYKLT